MILRVIFLITTSLTASFTIAGLFALDVIGGPKQNAPNREAESVCLRIPGRTRPNKEDLDEDRYSAACGR